MTYAETTAHAHYVTARGGARTELLAGPFTTHTEAAAFENRARRVIAGRYPFAVVGTARVQAKPGAAFRVGKLNDRLGVTA